MEDAAPKSTIDKRQKMGIKVTCTECKQKMVDNVLEHLPTCSANMFKPVTGYGMMPPGQTIHFDTPEEQEKFMKNLSGASSDL